MVPEHRRVLVSGEKVGKQAFVELVEHARHGRAAFRGKPLAVVDELVVLPFRELQVLKHLFRKRDAVAPVAFVHDVDGEVVDDLRVSRSHHRRLEAVVAVDRPHVDRVLAVFADVGDHVGDSHDASFEGRGAQRLDRGLVGHARLDEGVELAKRVRRARFQHLLSELAVVAEHAVERLQADVAAEELVEHAHRMNVVVEVAPGALMVARREEPLAGVPERRVPHVMAERDRLDELAVQPERAPDVARDAAYELHVEPAPANVVVLHEREHLGLAGVAVVGGHVHDLLDVACEGGPHDGRVVVRVRFAAHHGVAVASPGAHAPEAAVFPDAFLDFRAKGEIGD